MKKIILAVCAWAFVAVALGQTLPSPTMNNLTVNGTTTLSNPLGINSGGTGVAGSPTIGNDVRLNGAAIDGVTDAGPAINSCLAANTVCVIPPTTNGLFVQTPITVPAGKWLIGTVASGQNTSSGFRFPGVSWLICSSTISGACVTWGTANSLASGGIKNLTVSRQAGTPSSGQKGIVFAGGYNVRMENVSVINFDTCLEFDQGISGQGVNNYAQMCATHYWVFNTWAEFSQVGGRTGANGSGNYNTALDNIYYTSTLGSASGGTGPNSIDFVNYKFDNDNTACWLRWGNWTVTPGNAEGYNFVNVYKEPLPSGASMFCTDSTVPSVTGLNMVNSYVSQDTGPATMWGGWNAGTQLKQWTFTNNRIYVSPSTLAPTATGGPGINNVTFTGNFLPNLTITPGGTTRSDYLVMQGNWENSLTINTGSYGWQGLTVFDQAFHFTGPSDTFHNSINIPNYGQSGTTFNGATSVTYSTPIFTLNDSSGSNAATIHLQSNGTDEWTLQKSSFNNFALGWYVGGVFQGNAWSVSGTTGYFQLNYGMLLPITVTASLPSCTSATRGLTLGVGDASSPTYNGTLTGGGSTTVPVFCNGSAWTTH